MSAWLETDDVAERGAAHALWVEPHVVFAMLGERFECSCKYTKLGVGEVCLENRLLDAFAVTQGATREFAPSTIVWRVVGNDDSVSIKARRIGELEVKLEGEQAQRSSDFECASVVSSCEAGDAACWGCAEVWSCVEARSCASYASTA